MTCRCCHDTGHLDIDVTPPCRNIPAHRAATDQAVDFAGLTMYPCPHCNDLTPPEPLTRPCRSYTEARARTAADADRIHAIHHDELGIHRGVLRQLMANPSLHAEALGLDPTATYPRQEGPPPNHRTTR